MKADLENHYVGLKSADFAKDVDIYISEDGVGVYLKVRDYEEPNGEYVAFHARVDWEPLIEEAAMLAIDAVRGGVDHAIDIADLTELREEWIAMIAQFEKGVRTLTQAINGAKEIESEI